MQELFNKILQVLKENKSCAVATVVASRGSSPREVAAKILVDADGAIQGTIGGGSLERSVIADAQAAIKSKRSLLKVYPLNQKSGLSACGGEVSIFIDVLQPDKRLVIAGGGHIGLALSLIAKLLNFYVVIIDNRRNFANKKRFPHVDRVIAGSYKKAFKEIKPDKNTYVVIVTHQHLHDRGCLEAAVKSKAGYIGMIGSRTKIKYIFDQLRKRGVKKERLSKISSPIGLDIGAESPEEIAVAIAGQLVEVLRK